MQEAVDVLAARAPSLAEAMKTARTKAFVILDGKLLPIDRVAADTAYYSGKHKRHGMSVQVLTNPLGRLLWASPALPGSTHDLTAARTHGTIDSLVDKAYQGVGRLARVPVRGRRPKRWKGRHNTTYAKIRCVGEQAMAVLKGWRLLLKLHCCPDRITDIVKDVLALHHASTRGWKGLSHHMLPLMERSIPIWKTVRHACPGS
ncbi:hypothetical protein GCM10027028_38460 [Streptomyces sundarbansensis]